MRRVTLKVQTVLIIFFVKCICWNISDYPRNSCPFLRRETNVDLQNKKSWVQTCSFAQRSNWPSPWPSYCQRSMPYTFKIALLFIKLSFLSNNDLVELSYEPLSSLFVHSSHLIFFAPKSLPVVSLCKLGICLHCGVFFIACHSKTVWIFKMVTMERHVEKFWISWNI